jgi:PAS domain S-box-containing protein
MRVNEVRARCGYLLPGRMCASRTRRAKCNEQGQANMRVRIESVGRPRRRPMTIDAPAFGPGWPRMFASAFKQSRNPMALLDEQRRLVDVNGAWMSMLGRRRDELIGRPIYELLHNVEPASASEWRRALAQGEFSGETKLSCGDGQTVAVQWAATVEVITGRRLVLVVALSTSRWGKASRPLSHVTPPGNARLSPRELEVVRLIALGQSGPEIASDLQIAHDTVRTHARNAMAKLGARSRAHLVARTIGGGLVLPPAAQEQITQP